MSRNDATAEPERPPSLGPLLARTLLAGRELSAADRQALQALIERLCSDRAQGHVCLALHGLGDAASSDPLADAFAWPAAGVLRELLLRSGLCATVRPGPAATAPLPLVLDDDDRLYLRADFAAEAQIADWLRPRLLPRAVDANALRTALQRANVCPPANASGDPAATAAVDWQTVAIVAAAAAPFLLLTGGPGTGKTTTVVKALAVLQQLVPDLRIAVAAPTGKAAARLGEALRQRAAAQPELGPLLQQLVPTTLHRLLGYLPLDDAFRYGPNRPLPFDLVVLDEASMIDPAILACLCRALPQQARLWLVGDRDQLAAVAAGQVLGDLCRAAAVERGTGPSLAALVAATTGMALRVQPDAGPIADCTVALRQNHRFGQQPGIGAFAAALQAREPRAAMAALRAGHDDLRLVTSAAEALQPLAETLVAAARANSREAAANALSTVRILTASRSGPNGAMAWNARVEALLAQRGLRVEPPWYPGRPVLVTANDHGNRLYNGDLGVTFREPDGRLVVLFPAADGSVRAVPPLRLPAHETAFALTVHKAQGSEFDQVLLAMPEQDGPLWQASLLYTGITRARRRAILLADQALLPNALARWPLRASGLAQRLLVADSSRDV